MHGCWFCEYYSYLVGSILQNIKARIQILIQCKLCCDIYKKSVYHLNYISLFNHRRLMVNAHTWVVLLLSTLYGAYKAMTLASSGQMLAVSILMCMAVLRTFLFQECLLMQRYLIENSFHSQNDFAGISFWPSSYSHWWIYNYRNIKKKLMRIMNGVSVLCDRVDNCTTWYIRVSCSLLHLNSNCYRYQWETGGWHSCLSSRCVSKRGHTALCAVTTGIYSTNHYNWKTFSISTSCIIVYKSWQQMLFSHFSINGVPACANKELLTDIARKEWGFKGYVVSDAKAIQRIMTEVFANRYF